MNEDFYGRVRGELADIEAQGLTKPERVITSPQGAVVEVADGGTARTALNFCANNYLGLADRPELVEAARAAGDRYGWGT
ncbi:MAG: glycine C-acetyltransferase, partial [Caulobacterales bacterium]|nr:glycine C-acetyltransferase [Caulobacterales bacterium]